MVSTPVGFMTLGLYENLLQTHNKLHGKPLNILSIQGLPVTLCAIMIPTKLAFVCGLWIESHNICTSFFIFILVSPFHLSFYSLVLHLSIVLFSIYTALSISLFLVSFTSSNAQLLGFSILFFPTHALPLCLYLRQALA